MKKGIAFFDFDGTITTRDSLLEFIRFTKGDLRYFFGFLIHLHYIAAFKMKLVSNQTFKERMLEYFYKGTTLDEFEIMCSGFAKNVLPRFIRTGAIEEINKLKENGSLVVIVSASPEEYLRLWAHNYGIQVIGSRLEIKNNFITGKIVGKNCHGPEKVRRILELHKMEDYEVIYAYGDTKGDLPMMELATNSFYRPFRKKI